jgi:hypothetical protein
MSNGTLNERLAALAEQAGRRGKGAPVSLAQRLAEAQPSVRSRGAGPPDLRTRLAAHAEQGRKRGH